MNFVCVVFELGDKMLTLSSMENLIVPCNRVPKRTLVDTETDRDGPERTETDRNGPKRTFVDTETDYLGT